MKKKVYLSGWEVQLNNDTSCEHFVATHITDKKTAKELGIYIELVFEEGKLVETNEYWGEEKKIDQLNQKK